MKLNRPKTEKWHNYDDDVGHPKENYFKKNFWKRYDRKKFLRNIDKIFGL